MNRDEVLERIRAHLAAELEDSYGIRIPDEDAVKILTVGQAADYVSAHVPEKA